MDQHWKPTRLLYVGTQTDDRLRLCEGQAIPIGVRYTTLSHCWGTNLSEVEQPNVPSQLTASSFRKHERKTTLTQNNLTSWRRFIPVSEMMKTFQDAIVVTRSLGVQYIWIDSVCIVQDSQVDWQNECLLMSKVYKYSHCNIAATAARSDFEGCFRDRNPLIELPTYLDLSTLDSVVSVRKESQDPVPGAGDDTLEGLYRIQQINRWLAEIDLGSPLTSRAWVFQEV